MLGVTRRIEFGTETLEDKKALVELAIINKAVEEPLPKINS